MGKMMNGMKYKKMPVPELERLPRICLDIFNLPVFGTLILRWYLYFNEGSVRVRGSEGDGESNAGDSPKMQKS